MSKETDYLDKFEGAIIGSAVGDAFGYPLMRMSFEEICDRFEKDGALELAVSRKTNTALFTEATQMSLFTADGILWAHNEQCDHENSAVATYVFYSYQLWLYMQTKTIAGREYEWLFDKKQNPNISSLLKNKGLSRARRMSESNIDVLLSIREGNFGTLNRSINENADNGAVKRVTPVGLFYGKDVDMAFRMGCDVGAITHSAPDGYLPCGVYAAMTAMLLEDKSPDAAAAGAAEILRTYPGHENTLAALEKAIALADDEDTDPQEGVEMLGDGTDAVSCLAIAVYCAILHQTDYKNAIELAANQDGDSAACAAITGGLLGAWYGLSKLPKKWTKKVQYRNLLETVADVLYDASEYADEEDDEE